MVTMDCWPSNWSLKIEMVSEPFGLEPICIRFLRIDAVREDRGHKFSMNVMLLDSIDFSLMKMQETIHKWEHENSKLLSGGG